MVYTGIGSRNVPPDIAEMMSDLAGSLELAGYTLRSGGAYGADTAFEVGCRKKKEIFLPWRSFNNNPSRVYPPTDLALSIAPDYHPAWDSLKRTVRLLMARNVHQVLGLDCNTPTDFIVCWTQDGAETETTSSTGGTGFAIRMAIAQQIPVFNLKNDDALDRLVDFIDNM